MLGSQSWFTALALPTVAVGGFVATRKRLAYQWREELMDPEGTAYPTVTDADMEFFRRVAPATAVQAAESLASGSSGRSAASSSDTLAAQAEEGFGVPLTVADNAGLNVRSNVLPPEMCNVLLNEVQRWSQTLGNALDERKVTALEAHLQAAMAADSAPTSAHEGHAASRDSAGMTATSSAMPSWLNLDFLRATRVIADHAEDIQPMKAPWGCGDRMQLEHMPASLRYLVHHTQQAFEGMGRLRHVYIEYSPTGKFFRAPRPPKMYDGHDYVVIPLRRDNMDTVVTMSPVLRSRMSDLREVALHSWTSRDVDALIPAGSMLRVYGTARYEWGWAMRPGRPWFGSRLNPLKLPSVTAATVESAAVTPQVPRPLWHWRRWAEAMSAAWRRGGRSPAEVPAVSAPRSSAPSDAALVVLHFEGPRSNNKQRSLLLQPEIWIFGKPPSVETYETWYENRPTADSVREEGLVLFMMRNYFDMLTVS